MGVRVAMLGVAAGALGKRHAPHPHVGTVSRVFRVPRGRSPWDFASRSPRKRYTRTRGLHASARLNTRLRAPGAERPRNTSGSLGLT
jgi:hypothetical protein